MDPGPADRTGWTRNGLGGLWLPASADDRAPVGVEAQPEPASAKRTPGSDDGRGSDTTWRSYVAEAPAWAIVIGALAVSFWTQVDTVRAHRFADWESLIWGASTDAGTIAFLFLAREGAHRATPTWGAWVGSVACAAMSVQFNVVPAIVAGDWLAVEAHLWMPALALGTWYWLLHGRHRRWVGWTGQRRADMVATPQPAAPGPPAPVDYYGVRSPDGQWWWDRQQWRAVHPPVVAPAPGPEAQHKPVRPTAESDGSKADPEPVAPRTDPPSDEAMVARVDTLAAAIREARVSKRPVTVRGLATATDIPRTTVRRLLEQAVAAADVDPVTVGETDPLSTFRDEPAVSGQEVAA